MKYCRFQMNGQAHYGLIESAGGRDAITRLLLTAPEDADGDVESLHTRRIEQIFLDEVGDREDLALLAPVQPSIVMRGAGPGMWPGRALNDQVLAQQTLAAATS